MIQPNNAFEMKNFIEQKQRDLNLESSQINSNGYCKINSLTNFSSFIVTTIRDRNKVLSRRVANFRKVGKKLKIDEGSCKTGE